MDMVTYQKGTELLTEMESIRNRLDQHGIPEIGYEEFAQMVDVLDRVNTFISKEILPPAPEETLKFSIPMETKHEQDSSRVPKGQAAEVSG